MTPDDKPAFADAMTAAWALKHRDITPAMLTLCWGVLERFDLADVLRAIGVHASSGDRFPPQPGTLAELIEGSADDRAVRAWTRVIHAVQLVGAYDSVVFDDPLIHAVVAEMGGWPALCRITTEEVPFRQAEFVKRYRGHAQQRSLPPFPPRLAGLIEADPRTEPPEPRYLGSPEGCRAVLQAGQADHAQRRMTAVSASDAAPALLSDQRGAAE